MLTLWGSRQTRGCDGVARRDFLKAGALGAAGMALPDLLRGRAAASAPTRNRSVIWLWLNGGPSQLETFDPKPDNPEQFRGVVGALQTNVPGTLVGGLYNRVSQLADKYTIIRTLSHRSADHADACHQVMTGIPHPPAANGAPAIEPGIGSMVARHRGVTDAQGMPTYATTDHLYADGPAWMGRAFTPFHVRGDAVGNMMPRLNQERLGDRRSLLRSFDALDRAIDRTGTLDAMDTFERQAFEMIRGQSRIAFDIRQESPRVRERYGPALGENLLLARRLCEAGVGFVNVWYGGWDSHGTNPSVNHGTIEEEMHKLAPSFDRSVSALIEDIHARGLEDQILFVIAAEFGRTPWLDRVSGGRDHWPQLGNIVVSGGGLKMGGVVGESAARSDVPRTRPIHPQDLLATVFHVLDVPQDLTFTHPSGRPIRMLGDGTPIAELI